MFPSIFLKSTPFIRNKFRSESQMSFIFKFVISYMYKQMYELQHSADSISTLYSLDNAYVINGQ